MTTDLTIRLAEDGDREAIVALVRECLGEVDPPWDLDFWNWKHVRNPFGASPTLLAMSGDRIVGLRVFMRWRWESGASQLQAVRAVDTATHPDWRGRGIFSRLTLGLVKQVASDGTSFVFNTPNAMSRPGYLKMGWVNVGRTSLWVRPLRPLALLRARLDSSYAPAPLSDTPATFPFKYAGAALEDESVRELVAGLRSHDERLTTPRSVEYLQWRYVQNPAVQYHAHWLMQGDSGAVVFFRMKGRNGTREMRLCDIVIGSDRTSMRLGRRLVRELADGRWGDYAVGMGATGTPEQRVLLGAGFLPAPRVGPILTVRPLPSGSNGVSPQRRSVWRLSIGDLELF